MSAPPSPPPLAGRRVVVTRPRAQAAGLVQALEGLGAEVLAVPTIRIVDPADPAPLREAVRGADGFEWIVFTSVNAVERFWEELLAGGRDTRALCGVSICAIGPATAAALELHGARADVVPPEFVAEAVADAISAEGELRGARVLLPQAELARPVMEEALRSHGAEVSVVTAYRTVADGAGIGELRERLRRGEVDLVTFTAGSTVRFLVETIGPDLGGARVAAIGPVTAGVARELGLPVHVEAEEYTVAGLVKAIEAYYASEAGG